jgi:4-carboxymuconolactone decarboxylase
MSEKFDQGLPFLKLHLGEEGAKRAMENAPELTQFVVEHGFADFYTNEALDQKSRKVATLASLITSASLPQFEWHTRGALESSLLTKAEVLALIQQMTIYIGFPAAYNALAVAKKVFAEFAD